MPQDASSKPSSPPRASPSAVSVSTSHPCDNQMPEVHPQLCFLIHLLQLLVSKLCIFCLLINSKIRSILSLPIVAVLVQNVTIAVLDSCKVPLVPLTDSTSIPPIHFVSCGQNNLKPFNDLSLISLYPKILKMG